MRNFISTLALAGVLGLSAQTITGRVYDEVNQEVLPGATIQAIQVGKGATSDEEGVYLLEELESGRYNLRASYIGYKSKVLTDVWVKSGKVVVQDFALERDFTDLEEIVVAEEVVLSEPGRIYITEEQINRFAASYYDPARLATSSADVMVANDQNNQISARGIAPSYNTWRLEEAEIVNPNHLSNAGTFTDQPTATGGGVNMLSAQMLDRSAFLYSTFNTPYTNSVGGIFDMHLKNGNRLNRQYTAQASLIGFDLATEGPFRKGGKATYSANYRYSFTGLLTSFGVDFGGESIGFQDLALNVAFPIGDRSEVKVFGVGGLSFNNFEHKTLQESEQEKDRKDIFYDNKTGIIGANLSSSFNRGKLFTTLVFSGYENERDETRYSYDNEDEVAFVETMNSENILSLHSQYSRHLGRQNIKLGMLLNRYSRTALGWDFTPDQHLWQPYVQVSGPIGTKLRATAGLTYYQTKGDYSVDPRASITYAVRPNHSLSVATGLYSQLLNPYNYTFSNPYGHLYFRDNYELLTSSRSTFSYLYERANFNISTELFYYYFPEVNMEEEPEPEAHVFPVEPALATEQARTYGVTVSAEKSFSDGYYYRLGGSLFSADVSGGFENQYNSRYNLSLATGKEWDVSNTRKERSLSLNGRMMYQGGQYYGRSVVMELPNTVVSDITPYQTAPYFRFDVRIQWTRYRESRTSSIALDLQNAIGYENEAYKYYDNFTGQVETQYQLGLIPILTYRVEW